MKHPPYGQASLGFFMDPKARPDIEVMKHDARLLSLRIGSPDVHAAVICEGAHEALALAEALRECVRVLEAHAVRMQPKEKPEPSMCSPDDPSADLSGRAVRP